MGYEAFSFPGRSGQELVGRLELPEAPPRAFALFAHCFTCTKDVIAARTITRKLSEKGIAALRFDFTGLGHSEGDFANTSFTSNVDDLVAAAEALTARSMSPAILIGHSLGGAAVLAAATRLPAVKGVVTIGAPFDPAHVTHHFGPAIRQIENDGVAEVTLAGKVFKVSKTFLDDVREQKLEHSIATLRKALLVMHAPSDQTVGIENAASIFAAAKHPKSFVSLDSADHLLSSPADAGYAARVIAAWVSRYVPAVSES